MFESDPFVLGEILTRTLIVYVVLMLGLRLAGKRELGQMSVFDLVVVLVIASAVQNAMIGTDASITGGLVAALTLLGANAVVGRIASRRTWLGTALRGTPTMLINHGQLINEHLIAEGLTLDDLLMVMREHGFERMEQVKMAVLEIDGTISIIPEDASHYRTTRPVKRLIS